MSMKTRYLLSRSGRNQFGDRGDDPLPKYVPSPETMARDALMRAEHRKLNERFLQRHKEQWLAIFKDKKTMKSAWSVAFPHGRPSYSTFCKECKEFASLEEYLCYLLLSRKRHFLLSLGFSKEDVTSDLKAFEHCGNYFVTYGKSPRLFYTPCP
jgi:hypothetical protein